MLKLVKKIWFKTTLIVLLGASSSFATDFSDNSFLITEVNPRNYNSQKLWNFLESNQWTGVELRVDTLGQELFLQGTNQPFETLLERINTLANSNESKIIPVFLRYKGDVILLDSLIQTSPISSQIFYLPQGETWPSLEYLVQANRRVIFFVEGNIQNESRILHEVNNYALQITADRLTPNSVILGRTSSINLELFKVDNFDKLPVGPRQNLEVRNLVPDYINYLLENWKKFGKKPNFIFIGPNGYNLAFIVDALNSFQVIKGRVRLAEKNLEKIYWKNPDVLLTGSKFSFPYRGGEELILSPFTPGYQLTPKQIIITGEMQIPGSFSLLASPLKLSEGLKTSFKFEENIVDEVNPTRTIEGINYSFSQDIDRGNVLRLPENANLNLGDPNLYGLPNSSFTVSCFVKFTEILEFGDNAILGNYETGYRRGLHLILRSGHPYFGLWANDFISEETLQNNVWYHLAWRYIIETGEQAIFVNGNYVGGTDGHPPYSGTSDLHLGSALSQGASMRGYIDNLNIWNRPLGKDEINKLALDEEINLEDDTEDQESLPLNYLLLTISAIIIVLAIGLFYRRKRNKKKEANIITSIIPTENQIQLFGKFRAVNASGEDVTQLFTPKVKELLIFIIIQNLKNAIGASVSDINETLWEGIESKKVANNRAVTLNKLRKILVQFNSVEIISHNGYLQLKISDTFFCDYIEAFKLCQIPGGITRNQLETFYHLVKNGRLLKGTDWLWLDDMRGFIGNQVIDNLLKLASINKKENRLRIVKKVAERILDYDDLNEEAIYLQIWALKEAGNTHLAKFNFTSFLSNYQKNMGEDYPLNFTEFTKHFAEKL